MAKTENTLERIAARESGIFSGPADDLSWYTHVPQHSGCGGTERLIGS